MGQVGVATPSRLAVVGRYAWALRGGGAAVLDLDGASTRHLALEGALSVVGAGGFAWVRVPSGVQRRAADGSLLETLAVPGGAPALALTPCRIGAAAGRRHGGASVGPTRRAARPRPPAAAAADRSCAPGAVRLGCVRPRRRDVPARGGGGVGQRACRVLRHPETGVPHRLTQPACGEKFPRWMPRCRSACSQSIPGAWRDDVCWAGEIEDDGAAEIACGTRPVAVRWRVRPSWFGCILIGCLEAPRSGAPISRAMRP